MNRIDNTLEALCQKGKKMLSPYITAGDPTSQLTVPLMHELVRAGANILEIGIPFSDPMAEGPVIQGAMERALANGVGCEEVLSFVHEFRQNDQETPIVLMGYLNPIEQYGYAKFAKNARAAGVDGTILVDLPPEESDAIAPLWRAENLHAIYLCSPTTSEERLQQIKHYASGYLYYVSLKGVTGANSFDINRVKTQYLHYKSATNLPIMVGFGIKTPEMAAEVASFADGVIVGAALINQVYEAFETDKDTILAGYTLIHTMRQAMDNLEIIL